MSDILGGMSRWRITLLKMENRDMSFYNGDNLPIEFQYLQLDPTTFKWLGLLQTSIRL